MPCEILFDKAYTEVVVRGDLTAADVLDVIKRMHAQDPCKERADLWVLPPEIVVPMRAFEPLIQGLKALCAQIRVGSPSAIVSSNAFQRAQLTLYLSEASTLPYQLRIFESRPEAVAWIEKTMAPTRKET